MSYNIITDYITELCTRIFITSTQGCLQPNTQGLTHTHLFRLSDFTINEDQYKLFLQDKPTGDQNLAGVHLETGRAGEADHTIHNTISI